MILPTLDLEKSLWEQGYKYVAGVDEVGRGPLAGPLVAGAVVMTSLGQVVDGVRDSKKMSEKRRVEASKLIMELSSGWGIGEVSCLEIDNLGISKAVNLAMLRAIENLTTRFKFKPDILIIDGKGVRDIKGYKSIKMDKGDLHHYSIAAASIIAKVYRDNIMKNVSLIHPNYSFDRNMGYGTKEHIDSIAKYGICNMHRKSFAPIKNMLL